MMFNKYLVLFFLCFLRVFSVNLDLGEACGGALSTMLMKSNFFKELNKVQQKQLKGIVHNSKQDYNQMCQKLSNWLENQPIDIQNKASHYFNNFKKASEIIDQQIPKLQAGLSPMARHYTEEIESVENFPSTDAYLAHIEKLYNKLPPAIKHELTVFSEKVKELEDRTYAEYMNRAKRFTHIN